MTYPSTHQARRAASLAGIKQQEEAVSDKVVPERWTIECGRCKGTKMIESPSFRTGNPTPSRCHVCKGTGRLPMALDDVISIAVAAEAALSKARDGNDMWHAMAKDLTTVLEKKNREVTQQAATLTQKQETIDGLFAEVDKFQQIIIKNEPVWLGSGYSPAQCLRLALESNAQKAALAQQAATIATLRKAIESAPPCECLLGVRAALASLPK